MKEYKYPAMANYEYYDLFGTPVKQLILRFLYKHAGKKFSVLDLEKQLNIPSSSLSKALAELNDVGLLERNEEGKFVYYELDNKSAEGFRRIYENLEQVHKWSLQNRRRKKKEGDING